MTDKQLIEEALRLDQAAKDLQHQADLAIEKAMACNRTSDVAAAFGVDRNTIYNRIARANGRPFGRARKSTV